MTSDTIMAPLFLRLQTTAGARPEDLTALKALPLTLRHYRLNQPILRDGDRPSECSLVVDGFCVRSKTIADGRRQILSIHIPGDLPDLQSLHLATMDHDLVALSDCTLAIIAHTALKDLIRSQPTIGNIFWRDTLVDAAVFREWIVNVGQRAAHNRLAHLIVELRERLRLIGYVVDNTFAMPLTQEQLGEAMGVTSVHTNRIIRQLRVDGVLEFQRGTVTILDEDKLQELVQFDGRYLHGSPSA
ncbi:MAG TPA: Crp/Fnr family transcriptional regulator [Bradyrhizobium sp.]|uniref:Crp/Fnr family transcriptional regulator n=1 Tax=Bradyrhizobium sp. TaxID=376 RepID=UPI002D7E2D9E|nr:Crp/Fnr family transcriptional regulator [Bradyrhizobium sp.]HET7885355.1 Crp/Fnr family transcriptional regulator [Bradyrhizobium sp.]